MSNDSTTPSAPESRDGEEDAVVPPPPSLDDQPSDAVVPPPPTFDDDPAAVIVPPPPTFDGPLTGSVPPVTSPKDDDVVPPPPVFEGSTGDAVVPPPPSFDGPVTGSAAPASDALRSTSRRAASTGVSAAPTAGPDETGPAPDPDPAFAAPETPSSGSYRGLTVAIYAFLLILLAGAVALGIYLATNTTLDWSIFGAAPWGSTLDDPGA
ncbi:hypothetical protein [Microbacterium sp. 179-I 3D4 NHS]|uniref:hypothetical protein n=1 Tax=Microbacterium sp. 179-I 3D4 NHS TaxID=3142381 RepID=UPI0039A08827